MRFHGMRLLVLCLLLVPVLVLPASDPGGKEKTWVVTVLAGPAGQSFTGSFGNDVSDSGYVVGGCRSGSRPARTSPT